MSGYRDQLEAARLRIESLEANLAERNAALGAREAELRELAAKLGRSEPSPPRPQPTWALTFAAGLSVAASLFANSHTHQQLRLVEARASTLEQAAKVCEARDLAPPLAPPNELPPYRIDPLPTPSEAAFDREAASRALGDAAERARRSCWRIGAPEVPLRVKVTFSPGGEASDASTDAPVHATPAGRCVERVFARAEVPRFDGPPTTVSMSFAWR